MKTKKRTPAKQASEKHVKAFRPVVDVQAIAAAAGDGFSVPTEIHILSTGSWETPWHGDFIISESDLQQMIEHFDNKVMGEGIAIDREHYVDQGAAGWYTKLYTKPGEDGEVQLWASVEWTTDGEEDLSNKRYRFFSPEFAKEYPDPENRHVIIENVLLGGAITNRPLFKSLTPIMANRHNGGKKASAKSDGLQKKRVMDTLHVEASETNANPTGDTKMNLKDILAKDKADLNDEEKQFLNEHKDELTDEQRSEYSDVLTDEPSGDEPSGDEPSGDQPSGDEPSGDEPSGDEPSGDEPSGDQPSGDEPSGDEPTKANRKDGKVTISASQLKRLEATAERFERVEASQHLSKYVISASNKDGKVKPAQADKVTDLYMTLSASQRKLFEDILSNLPGHTVDTQVRGSAEGDETGTAWAQIQAEARKLVKASREEKGDLTEADAISKVLASRKDLRDAHLAEQNAK
jgi:hypothetical protein